MSSNYGKNDDGVIIHAKAKEGGEKWYMSKDLKPPQVDIQGTVMQMIAIISFD